MTNHLPEPVLRAREIHKQVRIPRISTALDLQAVHPNFKSRIIAEKLRNGLRNRMKP